MDPPPSLRLQGKVALVTGGASGIGEATVRLLSLHGASIVIADLQEEKATILISSIPSPPAAVFFHRCDVNNETHIQNTIHFTLQKFGILHVVFTSAGIMGPLTGVLELDVEAVSSVISTNVISTAATIKHAGRAMVEGGVGGSIICAGSVAGVVGGAAPLGYTLSKHGVVGLVKHASGELGRYGIRVNCVSPFGVSTPMIWSAFGISEEEVEKNICGMSVLKRTVLKARNVADAVLFLASDESSFISGHNLVLDGGFTTCMGAGGIIH